MSQAELYALEQAAARCRLSVRSFLRVLAVDAVAHPERQADWQAIAARLMAGDPAAPPKRPGRPKKDKG